MNIWESPLTHAPYHHVVSKAEGGSVWPCNRSIMGQLDTESGETLSSKHLCNEVIKGQGMQGVFDIPPETIVMYSISMK
jgi:hypothetical protein